MASEVRYVIGIPVVPKHTAMIDFLDLCESGVTIYSVTLDSDMRKSSVERTAAAASVRSRHIVLHAHIYYTHMCARMHACTHACMCTTCMCACMHMYMHAYELYCA